MNVDEADSIKMVAPSYLLFELQAFDIFLKPFVCPPFLGFGLS